jgi:DNA-binding MarR family transcriptional regulator
MSKYIVSKRIVRILSILAGGQPAPGGDELMERFMAIAHAIRQQTNTQMNAAGLSLARFRALRTLRPGPMRMNELSAALGVVPRTATTLADALERDGLVQRLADPADRRATLIGATEEGLRQLRAFQAGHGGTAGIFEQLTPAERRQLAALLDRLRDSAAAKPEPAAPRRRPADQAGDRRRQGPPARRTGRAPSQPEG